MGSELVLAVNVQYVVTRRGALLLAALTLLALAWAVNRLILSSRPGQVRAANAPQDPGAQQVHRRRTGIKALTIGSDGRASTSKVQMVLWTAAVFYALLFLLLWGRSIGCARDDIRQGVPCEQSGQGRAAFTLVTSGGLQHEYYALLGLPAAAAIAAKAMTGNKLANRELHKQAIDPEQGGLKDALTEVITNDHGETDLIDFQYFAFTLLTLAFFLTEFLTSPDLGLPDIPPTLVALSGVSTGAYTAKKALERDLAAAPGAEELGT